MNTTAAIIAQLKALSDPNKVEYKAKKFNVRTQNSLGIYHADLNKIARQIPKKSDLAIELWNSGLYEARLLASKIFRPKELTHELAETWVIEFDNWEICDSFSMGVFGKSPLAIELIHGWRNRKEEFVKRAAFATMAAYVGPIKKLKTIPFSTFCLGLKKLPTMSETL